MLFSEQSYRKANSKGSIEVICGSMFSGKTEELIRRLKRAKIANLNIEIFKPGTDTRYDKQAAISHDGNAISAIAIEHSTDILQIGPDTQVVGIDEAQFFDNELPGVCIKLANRGIRVVVAGLDMDFLGNPFGPVPTLMSIAELVTKVHAICVCCGSPALYSFRTAAGKEQVLVGEKDSYEPRCRSCFHS